MVAAAAAEPMELLVAHLARRRREQVVLRVAKAGKAAKRAPAVETDVVVAARGDEVLPCCQPSRTR